MIDMNLSLSVTHTRMHARMHAHTRTHTHSQSMPQNSWLHLHPYPYKWTCAFNCFPWLGVRPFHLRFFAHCSVPATAGVWCRPSSSPPGRLRPTTPGGLPTGGTTACRCHAHLPVQRHHAAACRHAAGRGCWRMSSMQGTVMSFPLLIMNCHNFQAPRLHTCAHAHTRAHTHTHTHTLDMMKYTPWNLLKNGEKNPQLRIS